MELKSQPSTKESIPAKKPKAPPTLQHLGFPVFALHSEGNLLFVAGGGGKSRTGVINAICCFEQNEVKNEWKLKNVCQIPAEFGAPMNMACVSKDYIICGIDEFSHVVKKTIIKQKLPVKQTEDSDESSGGETEETKIELSLKERFRTDHKVKKNDYDESYQKVVRCNAKDHLICTGGTDSVLRLWDCRDIGSYFSPEEASAEMKEHRKEINDISFSESGEIVASVSAEVVCIWKAGFGKKISAELVTKLDTKLLSRSTEYSFKFGCFAKNCADNDHFYSVTLDKKRRSYISRWRVKDWKLEKHYRVHTKPITAFAISQDGSMIAFGTSEGSVACLNSHNLSRRWIVPGAHGFTVTTITFNDKSSLVISGSADQSCKVWNVGMKTAIIKNTLLLLTIFIILLSIYLAVWGQEYVELMKYSLKSPDVVLRKLTAQFERFYNNTEL